ncbi:MAG TPA: autotransporter-associated beta strand repeat-containing protein, partial [Pirellulales bacterium]
TTSSFGGVISDTAGSSGGSITKVGTNTQVFTGVNTYSGATTISNGTLALGVANAIATTPTVTLGDANNSTSGTLATGGFSQAMTATLALAKNGNLDLGLGGQPGTGKVSFLASNGLWGSSLLTIKNWTPGIDHLFFGTSNGGLDPTQVSDITFANFGAAKITASGEIVPVATVPTFVLDDVNGDGHFTVADISAEMAALTNLSAFQNNYGPNHLVLNADELDAVLDQNHDGVINNTDVQAAITSLANTGGVGNMTAVPEPASVVLLALGGMALAAQRLRRQRRSQYAKFASVAGEC